jgi:hypothetical protein
MGRRGGRGRSGLGRGRGGVLAVQQLGEMSNAVSSFLHWIFFFERAEMRDEDDFSAVGRRLGVPTYILIITSSHLIYFRYS